MAGAIASRVYDLYGRFYDHFEMIFKRRLARAIAALPLLAGDRVLDIGIGTGLSLAYYPDDVNVTGVDLSAGMLRQAQRKLEQRLVRAAAPRMATQLVQCDALTLPFAEESFDAVFLSHVISTVPDATRCLAEAIRVGRERAVIVLVNHFRSRWPVVSCLESAIDPICRRLGWRSDLSLESLVWSVGVTEPVRRSDVEGAVFQIVFLEKGAGGGVRVIPVPEVVEREAKLGTA